MIINDYVRSFDHVRGVWAKKAEATAFADFAAHELGLNRKGLVVEPDGRSYRIRIPLIGEYWHPRGAEDWYQQMERTKEKVQSWLSD